jgi:hypothetical protein
VGEGCSYVFVCVVMLFFCVFVYGEDSCVCFCMWRGCSCVFYMYGGHFFVFVLWGGSTCMFLCLENCSSVTLCGDVAHV